jgi:hypothetical protein
MEHLRFRLSPIFRRVLLTFSALAAVLLISLGSDSFGQAAATKSKASNHEWKQVSSFKFDWDGRGMASISLEIPSQWKDPGDFTRIRISTPGRDDFVLTEKNGWVRYGSEEASLARELKKRNLIRSDYVLALKARENRTLIFLFGYSYASSPGSLDVLELAEDGRPRTALHRDEFGLKAILDLDGDGLAEIVGFPCLSQEWGDGILTYDPFNVYTLGTSPAKPAQLSLPLSKAYNLEHYYGWAGAECSEELAVVLHPPKGGKPVVVPAKEAEKMMSPKPKRQRVNP